MYSSLNDLAGTGLKATPQSQKFRSKFVEMECTRERLGSEKVCNRDTKRSIFASIATLNSRDSFKPGETVAAYAPRQ
jgi:hypothetical protein